MLLTRYDAFAGRRILVLGSTDLALETALLAHARGIEVAALVEVRDAPQVHPGIMFWGTLEARVQGVDLAGTTSWCPPTGSDP